MTMVVGGVKVVFSGEAVDLAAAADQATRKIDQLQANLAKPVPVTGAEQAVTRIGQKTAEAAKLSSQQLASMQFQLQDMAVGLASGQSPFTVMMQQGSQLAQGFTSGTGVMGALKAVGSGITTFLANPLNLAVVGAGVAAAAVGAIATAVMANFPTANDQIEKHNALVKEIGESWDGPLKRVKQYATETRNTLLFTSQMAAADLQKALRSETRSLASLPQRYQGFVTAGISETSLNQVGNGDLRESVLAFNAAVRAGKADVMGFRDEIARIGAASDDPRVDKLVQRLLENTAAAAELEQSYRQNQDITKGLKGDTDLLNTALGKGTEKVQGLTSALDRLAGTRHDNIFGATTLKASPGFSGNASIGGFATAPEQYRALVLDAARQYGLDPDLLARQIGQESSWNANAVSKRGAKGLMQLMPGTAGDLGVADPLNPYQSIFGGARYMGQLSKRYAGNTELALMAYNWGMGNVDDWTKAGADPAKIPAETRGYLQSILGGNTVMKGGAAADKKAESEKEKLVAMDRRWAQVVRESTAAEDARSAALGRSAGESARLRKEQELWGQAQRIYGEHLEKDKALNAEVTAAIGKQADEYGRLAEAAEFASKKKEAEARMEQQRIAQLDMIREIGGGITTTFLQAMDAGQGWGASLSAVFDSVKQKGLAVLDSFIDTLLFGQKGTENAGIIGGLGKSLMDGFVFNFMGGDSVYAKGAAFAGGIEAFAGGGAFTNTVVSRPTLFGFGNRLGLMGEAGPEAVMPLSGGGVGARMGSAETRLPLARLSDGSLGVSLPKGFASGDVFGSLPRGTGGATAAGAVNNISINNYGSDKVETKATPNASGGVDLEVLVGKAVNRHIATGGADETLSSRYTGIGRRAERYST